MIAYTKNELVPISEFAKNTNKFLNSIKNRSRDKIAIVRNNRPEAVIIDIDEYEYLCKLHEISEDAEIYNLIKIREQTPREAYLSHEEMMRKLEKNE
ncbi:MAG: hypothetical protein AB7S75_00720 [Desulfococcaceae bacterium]